MHHYYVYILTNKICSVTYIGVTNDLIRRVYEHKNELVDGFSKKYKLHTLIYFEETENIEDAIKREKQLKGWTRSKKEKLINTINPSMKDLYEEIIG